MISHVRFYLIIFITMEIVGFVCQNSRGDENPAVLFAVDAESDAQALQLVNSDRVSERSVNGIRTFVIQPTDDPYEESAWLFHLTESFPETRQSFVLEVEFMDEGAGLLDAQILQDDRFNGQWRGASRKVSYTRLNTGRVRSAFFEFQKTQLIPLKTSTKPHVRITGLQNLMGLKAHATFTDSEWKTAYESVPVDVKPIVSLQRPMDIVCSAGVAVLEDGGALQSSLDALHELAPLAKVLGFNAVEAYVKWNLIEPEPGRFDFSFYDAVVDKLRQYDLQWFPLLIVGSAYALPDWFRDSEENVGFVCLEHGISNLIQSIWSPHHQKHVTRVLQAFGRHYEPMKVLRGVRLGPSGNYGESQYPAGGNWGYKGQPMHIHIGFWAGDAYAELDFQNNLKKKYGSIESLNQAWDQNFSDFSVVKPFLPMLSYSKRRTLDLSQWYTRSMSEWCEWWALEARRAMPNTPIYQSAGGWGFLEAGTDYVDQAKSMVAVDGGIRLTNETDSFHQNFFATRLAATAARLYGIDLGYEPASSHTARGTVGRLFNTITTNGDHYFTYSGNIFNQEMAIRRWLEHYPLLDSRQDPVIDVAVYYPETMNQLDPGAFRYLYAWGFNPRAREVRQHVDVDYLNETLIRDGFLNRYKVLVFAWGAEIEKDVEERINAWLREGGSVIYPSFPRGDLETIEGDKTLFRQWSVGDTGKGHFYRFRGDMEPPSLYGDYANACLSEMDHLHPLTQFVLRIQHQDQVFFSVQQDGHILALNYGESAVSLKLPDKNTIEIQPYQFVRINTRLK